MVLFISCCLLGAETRAGWLSDIVICIPVTFPREGSLETELLFILQNQHYSTTQRNLEHQKSNVNTQRARKFCLECQLNVSRGPLSVQCVHAVRGIWIPSSCSSTHTVAFNLGRWRSCLRTQLTSQKGGFVCRQDIALGGGARVAGAVGVSITRHGAYFSIWMFPCISLLALPNLGVRVRTCRL